MKCGSYCLLLAALLCVTALPVRAAHTPGAVLQLWQNPQGESAQDWARSLREGWDRYAAAVPDDQRLPASLPASIDDASVWQLLDASEETEVPPGSNRYWWRRVLPETPYADKALLFANLQCGAFAVYLGTNRIYTSGSVVSGSASSRLGNRLHLIPLPSHSGGDVVDVLFHYDGPGSIQSDEPVILHVSQSRLVHWLVRHAWRAQATGFLFLFVGLYAVFAHGVRRRYGLSFSPWFAFMAIALGMSQLLSRSPMLMLSERAELSYHAGLLAVLVFPIGLWRFVEVSLGPGRLRLIRRCWQLQIVVCLLIWVPDAMGWRVFSPAGQALGNGALGLQLLVGAGEGWRHIREEKQSKNLIAFGVFVFSLAGLLDIAMAFLPIAVAVELYPWGALVLVLMLALGQERAAGEAQIQLRRQAEMLQRHQQHLEQLVEERTGELRSATRAAESASRAKSDFLARMSHELRTPLNAILGYAQLTERDERSPSRDRERAKIIRESGDHLLMLINDILDISKIEVGKLEIQPGRTDVSALLEGVVAMIAPRMPVDRIDFVCDVDEDLPATVLTDGKRVRQILLNLLSNAIKFTESGRIELQAARQADRLVLSVKDTGIGIAPKDLAGIFEPFQQVPVAGHHEGAGLGLSISRTLAHRMGGELTVQSAPGRGSVFRLVLPCIIAQTEKPPPAAPALARDAARPEIVSEPDVLPEAYAAMREAARIGDVQRVTREAARLKVDFPEHRSFLERLCRLAGGFDIPALQQALGLSERT